MRVGEGGGLFVRKDGVWKGIYGVLGRKGDRV